jgi:PA domain
MNTSIISNSVRVLSFAAAVALFCARMVSAGPAQIVIVNINAPGIGFNDPTPRAPVGGNTGTTLGQQRLIAFEHAASIWSTTLDSTVPIRIRAQFTALGANVLGSAGPIVRFRDFPNAEQAGTWYHVALANKQAGFDLLSLADAQALGIDPAFSDDINANFSSDFNFYLGLDNNHGAQNDLVAVLLHEFAHGLGFSQSASLTTGALLGGFPDTYNRKLFDNTTSLYWPQMTNAERLASATRFGRVVLDSPRVNEAIPSVLSLGSPGVVVESPAAIAGPYQFGTASFGTPIGSPNVAALVVEAVDAADAAGPATTDGCSPFANAGAVAGKIALVERGTCGFAVKARNAAAAGAVAAIIYNNAANAAAAPPAMANDGGPAVTITAVSLARASGLAIIGQLGSGVFVEIGVDMTVRAGADALGRARVYAPFPVVGGSSISHYDTVASRNLLMEPAINGDLTHNLRAPFDLTYELMRDIGWYPHADGDLVNDEVDCNSQSDFRLTIVIGDIDTGVPNQFFTNGCTSSDLIEAQRDGASNHGEFVSGVAHLTNQWVSAGLITTNQKGAVQSAAARSN